MDAKRLEELEHYASIGMECSDAYIRVPPADLAALIASARELERVTERETHCDVCAGVNPSLRICDDCFDKPSDKFDALEAERDAAVADLAKAREERDEAEAALEYQRDAIKAAVDGENDARARVAALEARAADEAVNADFILDLIDNPPAPTPAMVELFANAPAAPAKDSRFKCLECGHAIGEEQNNCGVTGCRCRVCAERLGESVIAGRAPSPLAAQLAEAVALLRDLVDEGTVTSGDYDRARAFLWPELAK